MSQRTIRNTLTPIALAVVSATIALGQSSTSTVTLAMSTNSWQIAQSASSSKRKLLVVTIDQPQRWKTCQVQSFTADKLVCSHSFGSDHTYLPEQIVALILPGDGALKLRLLLGFNGGLAGAIFGTVVLTAICPVCAAATGVAALFFFGAAGAILIGDDQPNRLLYLAPGQQLTGKLRHIQ